MNRCAEINSGMSMRELLCSADIIVGDYRDIFFESVLLNKPCFSTAVDAAELVASSKGNVTEEDIEEVDFCPVVESEDELAERITQIGYYDFEKMKAFKEKMLNSCDGNRRIVGFCLEKLVIG